MKETSLIDYVDKTILRINRRHAKKFSRRYDQGESGSGETTGKEEREEGEAEAGYESFSDVVHDIEAVVDLVWVSGTRKSPYLPTYLPPAIYSLEREWK